MPYPNFLGIGVQKSGTSWMHHQFKRHPEISMPPIKELHHFDRPDVSFRIQDVYKMNLRGRFIRMLVLRILKLKNFQWGFNFLLKKGSDKNYQFLFSKEEDQICGEFTPAYARLNEGRVADIARLMPDCKLIYLIRNPIDRVWSQIKMFQRRGIKYKSQSNQEILKFKEKNIFLNSSYSLHLSRWEKYFDSQQLFIGFFDQIAEEPKSLLVSVYSFLEVRTDIPALYKDLDKEVNKGGEDQIPFELEKELTLKLMPELEYLDKRFNNKYTSQWLARGLKVIKG